MDLIREKLTQLEEKSLQLQKQGKYGESLDTLEEAFNLKINAYGENSEEVIKTSEKLCELCNLIAMVCLTRERFDACFEFLKKAKVLCQNSPNFKAVTYNNMACYYRRTGKIRTALDYLNKALQIEITQDKSSSLADTHLNLCAVLSQLGKHENALEHVLMSIVLLQEEYISNVAKNKNNNNNNNKDNEENKDFNDRIAVLAIAFHNLGVELEFLKRYEEAIQTYKKAVKFSIENLGENHNLVENLKNVQAQAEKQIQQQQENQIKRKGVKSGGASIRINKATGIYAPTNNYQEQKRATTATTSNKQKQSMNKSPKASLRPLTSNYTNSNKYQLYQSQKNDNIKQFSENSINDVSPE